jgi:hypothetical protein
MSGNPDGLEGFALATGVVQNRDTGFVVGAFADALREGIGHSRILGRFSGPSLTVSSELLFYVSMLRTCGEVLALQCCRDSGMIRR